MIWGSAAFSDVVDLAEAFEVAVGLLAATVYKFTSLFGFHTIYNKYVHNYK